MRFSGTLLVVKDTRASIRFYQELLGAKIDFDLGDYVVFTEQYVLQQEETWRAFLGEKAGAIHYRNHATELFFEEDDIDAFVERLAAFPQAHVITPLTEHAWGQRVVRFYDPDGHVVEVGENMHIVIKRFLASGMSVAETVEKSMFPLAFVEACLAELNAEREKGTV